MDINDKIKGGAVWENLDDSDRPESVATSPQQPFVTYCYSCSREIPANSRFCPWCKTELFAICPKCGNKYSSLYPICNQCGTDRQEYLDRDNQLINLTPYRENNIELVHSGYRDGVHTHIHLHQLTRIGQGIDARYYYNGSNAADVGIVAHFYNGKCWFESWFDRENIHNGRLEIISYHKQIDDPYFHSIELSKGFGFEKIKNFFGKTVNYKFYPYMGADHSLTDLARKELKLNYWNQEVEINEWMKKYGHYFWQDIKENYDLLKEFLGICPYVFFEYDKFNK